MQLLFGFGFEFSLLFVVTCFERSPFVESLRSLWYNNTVFRNIEYTHIYLVVMRPSVKRTKICENMGKDFRPILDVSIV